MQISEWLQHHPGLPLITHPDSSLEQVTEAFLTSPTERDLYVISAEGQIIGHIQYRYLAKALLSEHLPVQSSHQIMERLSSNTAEDLMEHEFVTAHPEEELDNVLHRMLEYKVEDMPVTNGDQQIIGKINLTDVLQAVQGGSYNI